MEVFVRNLPEQMSEKQLEDFFGPLLTQLSINSSYCCQKLRGKCAKVTILDSRLAQKFLEIYGTTGPGSQAVHQLRRMGRNIYCSASRNEPDELLLRSLQHERDKRQQRARAEPRNGSVVLPERTIPCSSLACGMWDYSDSDLAFVPHYTDFRQGTITFGKRSLSIRLNPPSMHSPLVRIEIRYSSVQSMTVGSGLNPSLTLTLFEAPRIYEDITQFLALMLPSAFGNLSLNTHRRMFAESRVASISKLHESVVSNCLVYQFSMNKGGLSHVHALKNVREVPACISWPTAVVEPTRPLTLEMADLISKLCQSDDLAFSLKFQMQKLAQNGYLHPRRVIELMPEISHLVDRSGVATALHATRKLFFQIPYAGPETEAEELGLKGLTELLAKSESSSQVELSYLTDSTKQHEHMALVYKATVTPAGTYLYGPDLEAKNRVLRKYSEHVDSFLRVTFADEDMEPIRFDSKASNEKIYHERFKKVLSSAINVAGRGYEFLGFSHSSLRAQTCWFMAPFVQDSELLHARVVIAKLGDFSAIRSPAKCAARIGQAFSETSKTVRLRPETVKTMSDVERSGRVFSDGVGTFSTSILQKLWKEYATSRTLRPTLFQIRYAGK